MSAAKKIKKTCGTQVCYFLVPQSCQVQPSISPKLLSRFLPNLYIFALHITYITYQNRRKSLQQFLRYLSLKIARVSSHFSSSPMHKITNIFKSHKNNLPTFRFLLNLEHIMLIETYIFLKF